MGQSRRVCRASSPEEIALRAAERRAVERAAARNPENWGASAEQMRLAAANDVDVVVDERGRVRQASRADVFDLLHRSGGLSVAQHAAAGRLLKDATVAAGIGTGGSEIRAVNDNPDADAEGARLQRKLDAADRLEEVLGMVGRADARLLQALLEPMLTGQVRVWRVIVQQLSGETDRNAQAAVVRGACANLAGAYDWIDREPAGARRERRTIERALRGLRQGVEPAGEVALSA